MLGIADSSIAATIAPGDAVQVDNRTSWPRKPITGTRCRAPSSTVGTSSAASTAAALSAAADAARSDLPANGRLAEERQFEGKMIVVERLWDREAMPWQADWYRAKVGCIWATAPTINPPVVHRSRAARRRTRRGSDAHVTYQGACSRRCATWRPGSRRASRRRPARTIDRGRPGRGPGHGGPSPGMQPVVTLRGTAAVGPIRPGHGEIRGQITLHRAREPWSRGVGLRGQGTFPTKATIAPGATTATVAGDHVFKKPGNVLPRVARRLAATGQSRHAVCASAEPRPRSHRGEVVRDPEVR